jgi:hypothetical protein
MMPRNFSVESLWAEELSSIVSLCGFKPGHYNERFQRHAMTAAGVRKTKVLDAASSIEDFYKTGGDLAVA